MESVIMTTPGNNTRLKSRLRSAAITICARSSRNNRNNANRNHNAGSKNARNLFKSHPVARHNSMNKGANNLNRNNGVNNDNEVCDTSNNNGSVSRILNFSFHKGKQSKAREVYDAWCGRLGEVTRVPSESVQALFNDMQLYPSKTQVLEMLQCARLCGRRNSSQFLTFGEFCVFAGELTRGERVPLHNQVRKTSKTINELQCEVFLGGSCNPTTWRADIAIPALTKLGISYYNPQVSTWGPELMAAEHDAKESASVLLFVIDSQTRCVAGMIEVAHLVAKQRCLVLVVHPFTAGQSIMDEPLTSQEYLDLSEGQLTLLTLLKCRGVTVHNNLTSALQCTSQILRGNTTMSESAAERNLTDKLVKLREVFDTLDVNKTGELPMSDVCLAYYQFTNSMLRISDLYSIMDVSNHTNPEDVRINFEQFCGVIAEFSTGGCSNTTRIDDYLNQPLNRQTSANNNSNFDYLNNGVQRKTSQNGDRNFQKYDVYLGGSVLKQTNWRQNVAIPLLKKYNVTYYNPNIHETKFDNAYLNVERIDQNLNDKNAANIDINVLDNSKVLMFVITNETRCITSMILAAYYIALKKNVVLCVQQLPLESCTIGSDVLTKQAIKDYNRARAYLSDLAKHEQVPIFESISEAVQCAVNMTKER